VIALLLIMAAASATARDGGAEVDAGFEMDAGSAADAAIAADTSVPDAGAVEIADAAPMHRLSGQIFAKGTRTPVVAVITLGMASAGETDADGRFDLAVSCGARRLTFQAPGFEISTLTRDACADTSPILIRLAPRDKGPSYETVVTAAPDMPTVDIRGPELTKTPGTFGDPFRAIEMLPGVAAPAWPAAIYVVRGANPGNTGFVLDDLRVPALFHLALGPSVIHPYFLDGLEFFPGGYPARYGRAVAGLVSAQTREPATDMVHAAADVRLFDAGVLLSAPFPDGNGGVAAAMRYSYTGALVSALSPSLRVGYWDYQIRADRRIGRMRLTLLVLGSGDTLVPEADTAPEREYDLRFHRANLRARLALGPGELLAGVTAGIDHSRAPVVADLPIVVDALSVMPRLAYRLPTDIVDWEAGFDGEMEWLSPATTVVTASRSDLGRKRTAKLAAFYVSASIRLGERLRVTPELRLDSYAISGVEKWDLGPRLGARYDLDGQTWLSASAGRYSQPPSLPLQIPGAENFGLALYGLQTSWQGSLGIATRHLPGVEVEATGYVQRYVLTDLRDTAVINPDPLADDFLVRRNALSYGAELMIRRPQSERLYGWLAYTLSQNLRALGNGVIGPSDWDQRHILNLVAGYRLGRTTIGGRVHLNTGRPVLVRDSQAETFVRLPTFYQIDLRIDRRFLFDTFAVDVYFDWMNATASREVLDLVQDTNGQVHQDSYRIVLPSLGVHAEY